MKQLHKAPSGNKKKSIFLFVTLSLVLYALCGVTYAKSEYHLKLQRERFVKAREALRVNDMSGFFRRKDQLKDYPLYPYLEYLALKHRINTEEYASAETRALLRQYVDTYTHTYYARKLTGLWQRQLAKEKRWQAYLKWSKSPSGVLIACLELQALVNTGRLISLTGLAADIWSAGREPDPVCKSALQRLESESLPSVKLIWRRIENAIEKNNIAYALDQRHYLNRRDQQWVFLWATGHEDPQASLAQIFHSPLTSLSSKVVKRIVLQWGHHDLSAAWVYWQAHQRQLPVSRSVAYSISQSLALKAAYRHYPEAYEWLASLSSQAQTFAVKKWMTLSALYHEQWQDVIHTIRSMPAEEQKKPQWLYWYARALDEMGYKKNARMLYGKLAESASYYGFLSADKVEVPYAIEQERIELKEARKAALLAKPAIVRAQEFLLVGMEVEARREWRSVTQGMRGDELKAAAVLAHHWQWHSQAINTMARTGHRQDLRLRFPMPYQGIVNFYSQEYAIAPAWAYGVIRRESAFAVDARSSSGAIGLMQLMPGTAQYVGQLQGKKIRSRDLFQADINIATGTYYLRRVMDRFDNHRVLATAAYNAGPNAVSRWLPQGKPMPADIWVDTLSYGETRRYVRAVLAYSAIFEWRESGKPVRLRTYMRDIPRGE